MHKLLTPFNYAKLTRLDGKTRYYVTPDGSKLPSVTTILDKTADKSHLFEWRKRIGETKAAQITKEAAGVGTAMHKSLERYILGEDRTPGTNLVQQIAKTMADVVITEGLLGKLQEVWGNEIQLFNPGIYSGTTDLVGVYESKPAIIDFKQANKPKKSEWVEDYRMQICAYADAHNAVHGTAIQKGVILICTRDLKLQRFVIEGDEFKKYHSMWCDRVETYYLKYHDWQ